MQEHTRAIPDLGAMSTAVLSSRPVPGTHKLSNEAFLIADGRYQAVHHKHFFPQELGFFEDTWFAPQRPGFDVMEHRGLRIGVLLCTELMFNEWARHYRRQGAHVIVVPRASGASRKWDIAAAMAAIVSGCYVLSSNRAPQMNDSPSDFGGRGFVYSPTGELLAETSPRRKADIHATCVNFSTRSRLRKTGQVDRDGDRLPTEGWTWTRTQNLSSRDRRSTASA